MIWLVAFAAWPLPVGPKCGDRLAECREHGVGALEASSRAADHDGERGVACALGAAAHGAVEERSLASRRRSLGALAGRFRR